jgi:hypothetical protein
MSSTDDPRRIPDAQGLAQVLLALAQDGGEPGQRAWTALAGMTARICGRYSAEARAVAAAEPEPASLGRAAGRLARRAEADARFALGFIPWLAAVQMLLPGHHRYDMTGTASSQPGDRKSGRQPARRDRQAATSR